jgi:putative DNA methylase
MAKQPISVLSERWMPIDKIGAECMRERGASSALPPLYFLHVWWARRPLAVSRAAILGSILPLWDTGWPKRLRDKFPTEESYHEWFLHLIGIFGDPVAGQKLIAWAKVKGIKLGDDPYAGHKRAFTHSPDADQLATLRELEAYAWGTTELNVCDPMAGGGSIPFEAIRYGIRMFANELNPVASVILKATLDYPVRFGPAFSVDIKKWGGVLAKRVKERLDPYFPKQPGESIHAYIWARTVACPSTGKPVPLSPNWWLQKGSEPIAARLVAEPTHQLCHFEIVKGKAAIASKPDEGTVKKGVGRSPWTGDSVDGDYIKTEAQAGRMGQQLYAVGTKTSKGFVFRAPTDDDRAAVRAVDKELAKHMHGWGAKGLVPDGEIPAGKKTSEPLRYGIRHWKDMFAPRQLLSLVTYVEELRSMQGEIERECGKEKAEAIRTYLGLAIDKSADYNSLLCKWDGTRNKITNTFDRHDFSFKWSPGEFDAAANLLPWTIGQVGDAFEGIAKLAETSHTFFDQKTRKSGYLFLTKGSAASLPTIPNDSIHSLVVDPPYYDNVMYAECSDFFYVWQKRTVGELFPGWFDDELTNKDDEAVANDSRFDEAKNKRELAAADYERKMAGCFREMRRILHPDGVLTVMFTHKKVEAWNTLATSLIGAGFSIQTSWPVHTESEHSLHQAKKNAAASTILLVCRKRAGRGEPVWWDDIKGRVREEARSKALAFHAQGISGVDLYISTFGPVLSILSQNWPVLSAETDKDGQPRTIRPEVALDLAREEVIALRKEELLLGRKVQFDPITDWYLMAWDAFRAEQFPADEARKLAIVLGLELESEIIKAKRIATKKGADVVLQQPIARRKEGMVDEQVDAFDSWIDAAHTAMLVYQEDGSRACETFLERTGLLGDSTFKLVLQAMINAIPRTKDKNGQFIRPESRTLDDLRLNFFDDLTAPPEEELPKLPEQTKLFVEPDEEGEGEDEDEE